MTTTLTGRKWIVKVNGRTAANGKRYGATWDGTVEQADAGGTIYDLARQLVDYLEQENRRMEFPDSLQITIPPQP